MCKDVIILKIQIFVRYFLYSNLILCVFNNYKMVEFIHRYKHNL